MPFPEKEQGSSKAPHDYESTVVERQASGLRSAGSTHRTPSSTSRSPVPPAGSTQRTPSSTSRSPVPPVQRTPSSTGRPPAPPGYVQGPGNGVANVVCAPGLEYLAGIDMIIVEQQLELAEAILGCETSNHYIAKNSVGQIIYDIRERSRCCAKLCCGPRRCFEMDMVDYRGEAVVHVIRPLRCVQCWCFCCLQELQVQAPPGTPIGFVSQRCSLCYPTFTVYDRFYKPALTIVGPLCTQSLPCACDVKFEVRSLNGVAVGTITKKWSGLIKEYFTDIDNFGISFPMDLDVNMKATLLATTMLIDFMFFEKAYGESGDNAPGMAG
ncbi:phospholipid scramblase 2-like [Haemaphysalis longicornis]